MEAARPASALPRVKTSAKWSMVPAPPEAIRGMVSISGRKARSLRKERDMGRKRRKGDLENRK